MPYILWAAIALVPNVVLTCVLLRWLPVRGERWIPALSAPVLAGLVLVLRFGAQVPWSESFAGGAGFLWGTVLALLPFRRWTSSWTLPVKGDERLRWREALLVLVSALTPLSTRGTKAATTKAFTPRQVERPRGPFPWPMGVALLVVPVLCALAAGWASGFLER
ncbi:hypothetical protein [Streptomyces montanisoli]|uniref:Uncharacterized protein n=1 Tax=Streptomyces montanisoli TaxID=2798581 RepID=A0A940MA58_9ACTN|nr:hypothetical protein [Streptomyces montanisoli]MBP0457183.1 hypothetical protein [Streptomyces montanisoli]